MTDAKQPPLLMSRAELEALDHYQSTMPTGPRLGRRWRRCKWTKRDERGRYIPEIWWVAEVTSVDEKLSYITWREVCLLDAEPADVEHGAA